MTSHHLKLLNANCRAWCLASYLTAFTGWTVNIGNPLKVQIFGEKATKFEQKVVDNCQIFAAFSIYLNYIIKSEVEKNKLYTQFVYSN
jgi:hypothetical protein